MGAVQFGVDIWQMVAGLVVVTVWFVRLEAKVMYMDKWLKKNDDAQERKDLQSIQKDEAVWDKLNDMQETMSEIRQSLARLEGKMEVKHD